MSGGALTGLLGRRASGAGGAGRRGGCGIRGGGGPGGGGAGGFMSGSPKLVAEPELLDGSKGTGRG